MGQISGISLVTKYSLHNIVIMLSVSLGCVQPQGKKETVFSVNNKTIPSGRRKEEENSYSPLCEVGVRNWQKKL